MRVLRTDFTGRETYILPSFDKAASCGKVLDRIGQSAGMLYAGLTLLPAAKVTNPIGNYNNASAGKEALDECK